MAATPKNSWRSESLPDVMRGLVLLLVVAAGGIDAASGTANRPDANLVRIDAVAADARGRTVADLTVQDFEIIEQGAPRRVESVQFVTADGVGPSSEPLLPIVSTADERVEAARGGTRLFAIFLDEYHAGAEAVARARAALTEFVDTRLGPRDLVLIVKPLDSLRSLRFTRDRTAILNAIATFNGRKGDYTPRTAFEQNYIAPDPERIDAVRAQIVTSALHAIAVHLGSVQGGRKTIVVVSEGFPRPIHRRGEAALPSIDTVTRTANRSGVSIYPIDPRVLAPLSAANPPALLNPPVQPPGTATLETIRTLARETGGQAILANADLADGIARIVSDASGYYVLAFHPASGEDTGRFHPIDIRVKRQDVTLRARPGYWEPLPDPTAALTNALRLAPAMQSHASPLIRPWFGFSRGDDGKTRVQYVWEPAARVPGERSRGVPTQTVLNALRPDGTVLFERVVGPGAQAQAVFDVEPGPVRLHIQIEDDTKKVLDTDVRQLMVAPLTGPVSLGTARIFRARSAREFREFDRDPEAVPVAVRQFSRTERLLIRVPVYTSDEAVDVTAKLVSGMGRVMRDLPVARVAGSETRSIDVPLAGLASGEYRIDLLARSGDAQTQDRLTFRVTP
jgi:VWFA-related protein